MESRIKTFFRIAPCLLAIIVDYAGFGLVYPLVSIMFTETNVEVFPHIGSVALKNFYLSLAYLLYPLGMFFGASFLGDLSDVYGRKKVLLLSMGGIFLSFFFMGLGTLLHLLFLFLFGRLLSGIMAGSQPLSQAAIADVSTIEEKPRNMSLISLTNCVGVILGPLIAGIFTSQLLIQKVGFAVPFFVAAFLASAAFFWIHWGFKETYTLPENAKIRWFRPIKILIEAFEIPKVRILALTALLFQLGLAIFYQTIAIYLIRTFHYSSSAVGIYYGFFGLVCAFGVLVLLPSLLKRFALFRLAFSGIFLNGFAACMIGFTSHETLIWGWTVPLGLSNIVGFTALLTLFSNSVDQTRQGWIMGIFGAMVAVAFALAGLSANLLHWISSPILIALGGGLIMLSSLTLAGLKLLKH